MDDSGTGNRPRRNGATELFRNPPVHGGSEAGLGHPPKEHPMNGIIYLIGLIVVIMAILSFFGLR